MKGNPCLSVIVPVYNVEPYLQRCIDSILLQTLKNIELILINDGSTDNSLNICMCNKKRDKRITVISQENRGPAYAREVGLSVAKGEYISFVDSDDWVDVSAYEKIIDYMENNKNVDVFVGTQIYDYGDFRTKNVFREVCAGKRSADKALEEMLQSELYNWNLADKIYRRSLFDGMKVFFEGIDYGEDLLANWYLFHRVREVYYSPLKFYHYFQGNSSLTRSWFSNKNLGYLKVYDEILSDVKVQDNEKIYQWFIEKICNVSCDFVGSMLKEPNIYDNEMEECFLRLKKWMPHIKRNLSVREQRRYDMLQAIMEGRREPIDKAISSMKNFIQNQKNDKIFIYGAGTFGRQISSVFDILYESYDGFVITKAVEGQCFCGKPVFTVEDILDKYNGNCGIILALDDKNVKEVMTHLAECGAQNVLDGDLLRFCFK